MEEEGFFEVIESIKKVYGQDVAIITCEELIEKSKGNCKKLVTEYIAPNELPRTPQSKTKISGNSHNSAGSNNPKIIIELNGSQFMKESYEIYFKKLRKRLKDIKENPDIIYGIIIKLVKESSPSLNEILKK